jgi:hypothetical protein
MAFDAELGYDPDLCHCGDLVLAITRPVGHEDFAPGLAEGYCEHCALTRCDAYPGDCGRKSVSQVQTSSR